MKTPHLEFGLTIRTIPTDFVAFSKDYKKTWQTINKVLGKRKKLYDIPKTFVCNGKILSGALEIAEGFNDFFANIGPKLAKAIP